MNTADNTATLETRLRELEAQREGLMTNGQSILMPKAGRYSSTG